MSGSVGVTMGLVVGFSVNQWARPRVLKMHCSKQAVGPSDGHSVRCMSSRHMWHVYVASGGRIATAANCGSGALSTEVQLRVANLLWHQW
jgi:hypothetical protein